MSLDGDETNGMIAQLIAALSPFLNDITRGRIDLKRYTRIRNAREHTDLLQAHIYGELRANQGSRFWRNYMDTRYELMISEDGRGIRDLIKTAGVVKGFNADTAPEIKEPGFIQKHLTDRDWEEKQKRDLGVVE